MPRGFPEAFPFDQDTRMTRESLRHPSLRGSRRHEIEAVIVCGDERDDGGGGGRRKEVESAGIGAHATEPA